MVDEPSELNSQQPDQADPVSSGLPPKTEENPEPEVSEPEDLAAPSSEVTPEQASANNEEESPTIQSDAPNEPADALAETAEALDTEPASAEAAAHDTAAADEGDEDEQEDDEEDPAADIAPLEDISGNAEDEDIQMQWFILKVQSNRENSICDGLQRRVAVEGLERYFGEILVPTEDVAEFKNGKRKIVKRKLYPGYIVVHMSLNDETWFLVRETPGIGDFTGSAGKPAPMLSHEVERIVRSSKPEEEGGEPVKTAIPYKSGDRVRIKEGTFENFEGDVESIDEANGRITVVINIFNRSTPVELEHWQIESV